MVNLISKNIYLHMTAFTGGLYQNIERGWVGLSGNAWMCMHAHVHEQATHMHTHTHAHVHSLTTVNTHSNLTGSGSIGCPLCSTRDMTKHACGLV